MTIRKVLTVVIAVCLLALATVYAASTHHHQLEKVLGHKTRQVRSAAANNLSRHHRTWHVQQRIDDGTSGNVTTTLSVNSSGQYQRRVRETPKVQDPPSAAVVSKEVVGLSRLKRRAVVNGFTSWDYEPFDKMVAFRTDRGAGALSWVLPISPYKARVEL